MNNFAEGNEHEPDLNDTLLTKSESLSHNNDERSKNTTSLTKPVYPTSYKDYYKWMGSVKEVRPITVTEDVEWHKMSTFQHLIWWIWTCIQILSLTILSIRCDRLMQWNLYLKYHWKHYSGRVY